MNLGLQGKKALVTGASRGLGRAIAETLAGEGVDLAICGRTAGSLEEATKSLESKGVKVVARIVDVADGDALKRFIAEAIGELGGLDILVSNPSGGNGTDEAAWRANFEVDLLGSVRSVEAALPALKESAAASVIFIGTTAAVETFIGPTSYNAIKAALVTHANGLSQSLGGDGIRVNTISPGPIFVEGGPWDRIKEQRPQMYEDALKGHPGGEMGEAQDVANAAVFVASPAAKHITGVNLIVDGGFTKRVNFDAGASASEEPAMSGPISAYLVCGGRWHDFDFARVELLKLLGEHEDVRTRVTENFRDIQALRDSDFLVTYTCDLDAVSDESQAALADYVASGKRWFALHGTNSVFEFLEAGVQAQRSHSVMMQTLGSRFLAHPPITPYKVRNVRPDHPLVKGIDDFEADDELYLCEYFGEVEPLLETRFTGEAKGFVDRDWPEDDPRLVMYLHPEGKGEVLYLTLGHCRGKYDMRPRMDVYPKVERGAWELPVFSELLRRGLRWAIGGIEAV